MAGLSPIEPMSMAPAAKPSLVSGPLLKRTYSISVRQVLVEPAELEGQLAGGALLAHAQGDAGRDVAGAGGLAGRAGGRLVAVVAAAGDGPEEEGNEQQAGERAVGAIGAWTSLLVSGLGKPRSSALLTNMIAFVNNTLRAQPGGSET